MLRVPELIAPRRRPNNVVGSTRFAFTMRIWVHTVAEAKGGGRTRDGTFWIQKGHEATSGVNRYALDVTPNAHGILEAAAFLSALQTQHPIYFDGSGHSSFTLHEFDKNLIADITKPKAKSNQVQALVSVVRLVRSYCVE